MKKVKVSELIPGMKLAKDVFLPDGRILLLSGFIIKHSSIVKLVHFNIVDIYIEDDIVEIEEKSEEKVYSEAFSTIKNVMQTVRDGQAIELPVVTETVENIVSRILNDDHVFLKLSGIRDIDNYTFLHSVDVCIYSVITGKNLGLNEDELKELGIAAILHDIGKCKVPLEILNKPDKLSSDEFYVMQQHSVLGYEVLSETEGVNLRTATIVCQHHEKWDGSGYPYKLKDYSIDKLARIICVSDVYDALTADRVYKKKSMPHLAAEYLIGYSGIFFDPNIVKIFINNISIYPEGMIVLLNTGEIAKIVKSSTNFSIRPKVKVITRKEGPPVIEPYEIDLMENKSVFIVDIIS